MAQHSESLNRSVQVVNLDPAAEHFDYPVMAGEYIWSPLKESILAGHNPEQRGVQGRSVKYNISINYINK